MKDGADFQIHDSRLRSLQGNVWKFYVYKGLWGFAGGLVIPIIILFYLHRGISLSEFMILMSVLNISVFVFEVPTGIVADKFSRKWSVCLGTLCMGSVILIPLLTVYYPLLIFAFLIPRLRLPVLYGQRPN